MSFYYNRWFVNEGYKNYLKVSVLPTYRLLFWLNQIYILSIVHQPDSKKFIKLDSANIWGLCSNFICYKSFIEWNSDNILALWEAELDDTIDSSKFSVRHYLHFIWNIYVAHMQNFKIYAKEGHPFAHVFSLENSEDSYSCFWMALPHSPSYFVSI